MSSNDNLDEVAAPEDGDPEGTNRARRLGGVRSPVSEAVSFVEGDRVIDGWSLNISRGGLRAILDELVDVGDEFEITIGGDAESRRGRIVWVREEKGGSIVGVAYLDSEGSVPPPPEAMADAVAAVTGGDNPIEGEASTDAQAPENMEQTDED